MAQLPVLFAFPASAQIAYIDQVDYEIPILMKICLRGVNIITPMENSPFHVRFDINLNLEEAKRRFVNRIENYLLLVMREFQGDQGDDRFRLDPIMILVEAEIGEPHLTYVSSPPVFTEVWRSRINNNFSLCLQAIEGLYKAFERVERGKSLSSLNRAVQRALSQSEVDLGVSWQDGIFIKKGAKVLDDALVNEPLRWLADRTYRNVLIPFEKGLKHFLEGEKEPERLADAVTDMYEAIEALAKIVTGKSGKDLSGSREEFISKLDLPEYYKKMLRDYVDYGCAFRHGLEQGKPRTWPTLHETEAFVYLTGLFIRLAMDAKKNH